MANMSNMCDSCPNRHLANLTRSNGLNTAELIRAMGGDETLAGKVIDRSEKEANSIEALGCQWWWSRSEVDDVGNVRVVTCCGRSYLPHFMMAQGNLAMEACQTLQSTRNAMHEDMERMSQSLARIAATSSIQVEQLLMDRLEVAASQSGVAVAGKAGQAQLIGLAEPAELTESHTPTERQRNED